MNKSEIILVIMLTILLLLPVAFSQPILKLNENATLNIPCTINGVACSTLATCNITILNPTQDVLFNNINMSQDSATFFINLSESQLNQNGEYPLTVYCCDAGLCANRNLFFIVTPNGQSASTGQGILYIGIFTILFLLFVFAVWGGFQVNHIAGKSFLWLFAYILFIGVTFIAWNMSQDYLTSSPFLISIFRWSFLFFTVAFFPVMLFTIIFTIYMMAKIDVIRKMIDNGIPEDEAYDRTVSSGMKRLFK